MPALKTMKAKLAGLMVERVEHGAPGDFDNCPTVASIADKTLERLVEQFCPIDEADRAAYHALIDRHLQEQEEFIAVLKARPITGSRVDTRNLKTPWEQLPAYSPPRISKGSGTKPA
jgi:hypothetical protein